MKLTDIPATPRRLLAAALVALAVLFAPGAQPAQAQTGTVVWSATLTVGTDSSGLLAGCTNSAAGLECSSTSRLTDDDFTYGGTSYEVTGLWQGPGLNRLNLYLNKSLGTDLISATSLYVDGTGYPLASGNLGTETNTNDYVQLTTGFFNWSVGDTVTLELKRPAAPPSGVELATWSGTLTVKNLVGGIILGCENAASANSCSSTSVLTDDDFTYGGVDYEVVDVRLLPSSGNLFFTLNKTITDSLKAALTLNVGGSEFALADAALLNEDGVTNSRARWNSTGLSWSIGDTVRLSLRPELLSIAEGGSATFTLALSADPGTDATVTLLKTQYNQPGVGADNHRWNVNAATVAPESLTFTAGTSGNWGTAQTVTVTGVEDDDRCSEQLVILVLKDTTGGESEYGALGGSITGVYVQVADNDGGSCGGV